MRVSIDLPDKDYQIILAQIMMACRGYEITIDYQPHEKGGSKMKYLVYKTKGPMEKQEVYVVDASNFKVEKNHIIFKKGFKRVSFFQSDLVDYIFKEVKLNEID